MKTFDIKYLMINEAGYNRYSTERLEAKGIMHAWKLAKDHAKAIGLAVESVRQVIPKEESE